MDFWFLAIRKAFKGIIFIKNSSNIKMAKRKRIRERGKVRFSEYFKELKEGDKVAIKPEKSVRVCFPERIHGITGTIIGKRGSNYVIKLKEINKEKTFIIPPIHLKKIKSMEK